MSLSSFDVILMARWGLWVCRWKITEVTCCSQHIISGIHAINMSFTDDVDLDYVARVVFVHFLHCKVVPLPCCCLHFEGEFFWIQNSWLAFIFSYPFDYIILLPSDKSFFCYCCQDFVLAFTKF